jgi:hypothetical protein
VAVTVTAYTSSTVVTATPDRSVPASLRGAAADAWALLADGLSGLSHLEGEEVNVLTDGAVHRPVTVASGAVALDYKSAKVHVGLAYQALLKTKRIELKTDSGSSQGKRKQTYKAVVRLERSLNCLVGFDEDNLLPVYFRTTATPLGEPPELFSGDKEISMKDRGTADGYVVVANADPVPFTVVSITPTLYSSEL